jgi:hypothetical protein
MFQRINILIVDFNFTSFNFVPKLKKITFYFNSCTKDLFYIYSFRSTYLLAGQGINWLNIQFSSFLLSLYFCVILSTSLFNECFERVLLNNQVQIPLFCAKIISNLTTLRRSTGDVFSFKIEGVETFLDLKVRLKKVEKVLLELDYIVLFPTLGSRFRDNEPLKTKVKNLFKRFDNCKDESELFQLILIELN